MNLTGVLEKMETQNGDPIQYQMLLNGESFPVNEAIGRTLSIRYSGKNYCILCSKPTAKLFGEGLCYPCFRDAPENAPCIIHPELCRAHLHEGRDVAWEEKHHLQPHFVYLAQTSEVKVGVTRNTQIPTRWIDQGANRAIILASVPYRQLAGAIEVYLKAYLSDKTNWMKMLQNVFDPSVDLVAMKTEIANHLPDVLQYYIEPADDVFELHYPVLEYPAKVKSFNLEKEGHLQGKLLGIKGQYLLLEGGLVMNVRKHSGMEVVVSV